MAVAIVATLAFAGTAQAVTITEFEANPDNFSSTPGNIAAGADGNLWWTEGGAEIGLGRMSPTGERLPIIHTEKLPVDLATAPSGWVSWVATDGYGRRSPSGFVSNELGEAASFHGGAITLTPTGQIRFGGRGGSSVTVLCGTPNPDSDHLEGDFSKYPCAGIKNGNLATGIAASSAGTLWTSVGGSDAVFIDSVASPEFATRVDLPTASRPAGIAVGPEGNAWVAMWEAGAIDRITPTGARTRFLLPAGSKPNDLTLGPDGAFWIVESGTGKIGRMTTAGLITNEYPVPSGETGETGITVGPDGNIWFTDSESSLIGRLIPDPLSPGEPPATPVPAAGGAGAAVGADTAPPRFTAAPAFSPARFRVVGTKRSSRRGAAPGSTLGFSLSEAATVTVTIALKAPGRRAGKNCVAPGKAKPGAKRCIRYQPKGQLPLVGKAGENKLAFSGKVGGKPLAAGSYQASLVAKDAAGNASPAATASFTIVA
ncbi:MAG TPA: hypothetical protein VMF55_05660 [Solirubrobacterales bacterium]|nr:hypothetical protein [Solirubrobacterales bacterium]